MLGTGPAGENKNTIDLIQETEPLIGADGAKICKTASKGQNRRLQESRCSSTLSLN